MGSLVQQGCPTWRVWVEPEPFLISPKNCCGEIMIPPGPQGLCSWAMANGQKRSFLCGPYPARPPLCYGKLGAGGLGLSYSLRGLGQASGSPWPQFPHSWLLPALLHHSPPVGPTPPSLGDLSSHCERASLVRSSFLVSPGGQGPKSTCGQLGPACNCSSSHPCPTF